MAASNFKDPAALWREMLGQWEKGVNAMATQVMTTGEFSRDLNRVMGVTLRMQKATQELLGRYFDALNLPTKDDLRAIGERLQVLEEQIGRVVEAVERMAGTEQSKVDTTARVRRTKRYRAPTAKQL